MENSRKSPPRRSASSATAANASIAPLVALATAALDAHVPPGASVCVGLSGGIDSVVLFDLVARLAASRNWRLRALHVHHGLSPNADSWAAFCARLARSRRAPFRIAGVTVRSDGQGIEGAARLVRYAEFARADADVVLLAHHRDDQAETVLLQLLRGAGLEGLAAMPLSRPLAGPDGTPASRIVRPLLAASRDDIRRYARARRLRWIEDESNDDVQYARNFVRHRVLPLLDEFQPGAAERLARSAGHLALAAETAQAYAAVDAASIALDATHWSVAGLVQLGPARGAQVLRSIIRERGARSASVAQLDEVWRQLTGARANARVAAALPGLVFRRYRDQISVVEVGASELPPSNQVEAAAIDRWAGERPWVVPAFDGVLTFERAGAGEGIDPRFLVAGRLSVRARSGGERFLPAGAKHKRTLKNLFQEQGIEPWERAAAPLLYVDDTLAWVAPLGVAGAFRAAPGVPGWLPVWHPSRAGQGPGERRGKSVKIVS